MSSKRKFKRDYIILEAKDINFRHKERILPKAFAKVEVNDEKSIVSLYVENLKFMKDGYRIVAIRSDYETLDLGKVVLSEQGKGEFILNLEDSDIDIKGIALLYEKSIPLIGFKGTKIENYEEILFTGCDEYEESEDDDDDEYEEYEEIEYIEIDEDNDNATEEYEEIEYIEIEEYEENSDNDEYEEEDDNEDNKQEYYDECGYEETKVNIPKEREYNLNKQKEHTNKTKQEPKTSGPLLMPRQIKKGLKVFKEVKPFVCDYIENIRWWKIEISPMTLCGYTMPYLGYVNTLNYTMYSDSVTQSYKYRHYLFGVEYDEYNKRKNYIYAIPGKKDEQPDKGHTGFRKYQPCDFRNDNLGYWLCMIDSRTRRILK